MHPSGISYEIIKQKLPEINAEIAKILTNIVEFGVYLENDDDKLDIFIKHPKYDARPLEMGSGAEKTIASTAIRLALLNVTTLPKGDIFILDEPGTALDEENMDGFVRILELIKTYFKTVILISHLDSLKDCVDMQISIEKINGYAHIDQ
jgi:DNA repair exonuclease SbcCD ATPase subunit